jgi:ankyrin repeat protein
LTLNRFLLAQLYVESLASETTPKGIEHTLAGLKETSAELNDRNVSKSRALDIAYDVAMRRIKDQALQYSKLAGKVISWILHAKRQLSPLELQHAVAVELGMPKFDEKNMADIELSISVCAGLVILDHETNVVRFVHYTTQEYFKQTWKEWFPGSHIHIAKACVTYLCFDTLDVVGPPKPGEDFYFHRRSETYPLYQYAAQFWGYHVGDAGMEEEQAALNIIQSAEIPSVYIPAIGIYLATEMTGLDIGAHFGLLKLMASFLKTTPINLNDQNYMQPPLHWACHSEAAVKLLIDNGADTEVINGDGETVLTVAIKEKREAIVKLLLDNGADANAKNNAVLHPLMTAVENGNERLIELLLENGANIDGDTIKRFDKPIRSGGCLQAPLTYAAGRGYKNIAKLLLKRGANIEAKSYNGDNPLLSAASHGCLDMVKLLLENGADVESMGYFDGTPLSQAAAFRHYDVVAFLLENEARIEARCPLGRSPLWYAVFGGSLDIAMLLLDKGAEIDSREEHGYTPLIIASRVGNAPMVEVLLERRADIEAKSYSGDTALLAAIEGNYEEVVKLLLKNHANVKRKGLTGGKISPLSLALRKGNSSVLGLIENELSGLSTGSDSDSDPELGDPEFLFSLYTDHYLRLPIPLPKKFSNFDFSTSQIHSLFNHPQIRGSWYFAEMITKGEVPPGIDIRLNTGASPELKRRKLPSSFSSRNLSSKRRRKWPHLYGPLSKRYKQQKEEFSGQGPIRGVHDSAGDLAAGD